MKNNFQENLYKKHSPTLFRFISSKIDRREDAEEILQDTWISIFDSLPTFNHESSFLTWACAIARHEVADFYRKKKIKSFVFSKLPFLENLVSEALGPDLIFQQQEAKEEIRRVLSYLNEGYGRILRLKYVDDCSMVMIAQLLQTTTKAVESKLFRARKAFQKQWQKRNKQLEAFQHLPSLRAKRSNLSFAVMRLPRSLRGLAMTKR